jgi:hypothetical protein
MPATIVAIADAVVAQLNATTFAQPMAASRHYVPVFELSEMSQLRVSVVPKAITSASLDRNRDRFDYLIDVAVQRKLGPSLGNLDAMLELVEEISDHFRSHPLTGFPEARCVEVENDPVYAPDHLEEFRTFTSLLTLTYRVWR